VGTPVHVFVPRYRLVAVPGIALCWGLVVSRIESGALRLLFCAALVVVAACICFTAPSFHRHMYSWKDALAFVEKNASADNAPVLICSDLPEADHMRMPVGPAIEDSGFCRPQLLQTERASGAATRTLNEGDDPRRLGVFGGPSPPTVSGDGFCGVLSHPRLASKKAAGTDYVRPLGEFDGVKVLEFVPRDEAGL